MITRLHNLTARAAICATLLLAVATCALAATADEYLASKKYLRVEPIEIATLKANPSGYIGRTVEMKGTVSGIAKCTASCSFILDCGGESILVKTPTLPDCIANGNTVRALVRLGPGCAASLSDLALVSAAFDYDLSLREKQLAPKAQAPKPAAQASTSPTRAVNLASRGGVDGAARIREVYGVYRNAISKFNRRLSAKQVDEITNSLLTFSWNYQVDPRLVIAVVLAESHFRPDATSRCGAMGLGQLMPGTAAGLGVRNAYDPVQNLAGCVKLIRGHLDKYGDLKLALSAYNAGPGAVKKYGGVPPYRETQGYIRRVTSLYKAMCGGK